MNSSLSLVDADFTAGISRDLGILLCAARSSIDGEIKERERERTGDDEREMARES